jgi:hypothetical protein
MKSKRISFYLLTILLAGCVPVLSLHPLYTNSDIIFDEKLLGTWINDSNDTTWQFERLADVPVDELELKRPESLEKAYYLTFTNIDPDSGQVHKGTFFTHLTSIQNKLYLDVFPSRLSMPEDPNECLYIYNSFFLVPAHSFIKVDSVEPKLTLHLTDVDKLKQLLKEDPNAVSCELIDETPVLTAQTKQLQSFVAGYTDTNRLFGGEIVLNRKKQQNPSSPAVTGPNQKMKEK